jgi:hypothetical protein
MNTCGLRTRAYRVETPSKRAPYLAGGVWWGGPWSAAGPPAGLLRRFTEADEGVGRGPGGPPHQTEDLPVDRSQL